MVSRIIPGCFEQTKLTRKMCSLSVSCQKVDFMFHLILLSLYGVEFEGLAILRLPNLTKFQHFFHDKYQIHHDNLDRTIRL